MIGSRRSWLRRRNWKVWWVWWSGSGGDDRRGWRKCVLLSMFDFELAFWMRFGGICPRVLIIEESFLLLYPLFLRRVLL